MIVTVIRTVSEGIAVSWYQSEAASKNRRPWVKVTRERVVVDASCIDAGQVTALRVLLNKAVEVMADLRLGRPVSHLATHEMTREGAKPLAEVSA